MYPLKNLIRGVHDPVWRDIALPTFTLVCGFAKFIFEQIKTKKSSVLFSPLFEKRYSCLFGKFIVLSINNYWKKISSLFHGKMTNYAKQKFFFCKALNQFKPYFVSYCGRFSATCLNYKKFSRRVPLRNDFSTLPVVLVFMSL